MKVIVGIVLISIGLSALVSPTRGHAYQIIPITRSEQGNGGPAGQSPCGNDNGLFQAGQFTTEMTIGEEAEVEWYHGHPGDGGKVAWYFHPNPGDPPTDGDGADEVFTDTFYEVLETDYDTPPPNEDHTATFVVPPVVQPGSIITMSFKWYRGGNSIYHSCNEVKILGPTNPEETVFTPETCGGDLLGCSQNGDCLFDPSVNLAEGNSPMYCKCNPGWVGADCATKGPPAAVVAMGVAAGVALVAGTGFWYSKRYAGFAAAGMFLGSKSSAGGRYAPYGSSKGGRSDSTSRSRGSKSSRGGGSRRSKSSRGGAAGGSRRRSKSATSEGGMTQQSDFTRAGAGIDLAAAYSSTKSNKSVSSTRSGRSRRSKSSKGSKHSIGGKSKSGLKHTR